ncbi:glycosyltransferase [Streptomyces sp. NPDC047928]|uniref:glycosyltransferase n=1 Tax=unclassified Streptomyces TaxID=2593676 RepID=UPI003712EFEB
MNFADFLDLAPTLTGSPLAAGLRPVTAMSPELARTALGPRTPHELSAGYATSTATPITIAVLTRDEAEHIEACLTALVHDADRILLIDSQSTDDTVARARRVRPDVEVLTAPWCDDFAHHRNLALQHITEGWVVFVDADEVLREQDAGSLRKALRALDHLLPSADLVVSPLIVDADGTGYSDNRRILRASTRFRYRGRVHEKPYDREGQAPPRIHLATRFDHTGYTPEVMERRSKRQRNARLLELCRREEPDNATWVYYAVRDTTDFRAAGPERLRALFDELRTAVERPLPDDSPEYLTERNVDAWALLCRLAVGFGGSEEITEFAARLDGVGRHVEAAYFTALMESGRVLTRLSTLADRIAAAARWETVDSRHVMGQLFEIQATVALASGRYDLVRPALHAAAERGAGHGLHEDLALLRELLSGLDGAVGSQSS